MSNPSRTSFRGFMIAAPRSGSGKTTVTIALLRAFVRRGFRVRPYKVGPDYLDPSYHLLACGEESYNLDGWMTGDAYVKRHFLETGAGYDLAVVEGVMGLFDGRRGCFRGSSAGIAALLGLPVVLVVDCAGLSGSVAPLVHGFADFEEDVRVAGVILNNVASESHLDYLAAALDRTDAPLVGHVFRDESLRLRHRHLGLVTAGWDEIGEEEIERLSGRVTRHIDLDALLALSGSFPAGGERAGTRGAPGATRTDPAAPSPPATRRASRRVKIAVARDEAFHFYYPANLDHLRKSGAEISFFSPLRDEKLPAGTDLVYLGGGYPELYAADLSANRPMLRSVRDYARSGGPLYAECGGLIYLGRSVRGGENRYGLCAVFDMDFRMRESRKRLGYVEIELMEDTLIGPRSSRARGHEFHYSEIENEEAAEAYRGAYSVLNGGGSSLRIEGYRVNRALASYVHLHFGSNETIADHLVGHALGVA